MFAEPLKNDKVEYQKCIYTGYQLQARKPYILLFPSAHPSADSTPWYKPCYVPLHAILCTVQYEPNDYHATVPWGNITVIAHPLVCPMQAPNSKKHR